MTDTHRDVAEIETWRLKNLIRSLREDHDVQSTAGTVAYELERLMHDGSKPAESEPTTELRERLAEWPKPLHDEVAFIAEDAMLNEHERAVLRRAASILSRQDGGRAVDAWRRWAEEVSDALGLAAPETPEGERFTCDDDEFSCGEFTASVARSHHVAFCPSCGGYAAPHHVGPPMTMGGGEVAWDECPDCDNGFVGRTPTGDCDMCGWPTREPDASGEEL